MISQRSPKWETISGLPFPTSTKVGFFKIGLLVRFFSEMNKRLKTSKKSNTIRWLTRVQMYKPLLYTVCMFRFFFHIEESSITQCAIVIIPDRQTNERVLFGQDEMASEKKALGFLDDLWCAKFPACQKMRKSWLLTKKFPLRRNNTVQSEQE